MPSAPLFTLSCLIVAGICAPPALGQPAYSFATVDPPGASNTFAQGVSNAGHVAGNYDDALGNIHGFVRTAAGTYTSFDFPGARYTFAADVNATGQVVGTYTDTANFTRSYLLSAGTFTTLAFPGASQTLAYGINDSGAVVGGYVDAAQTRHGFRLTGGVYTTVDVPGAADNVGAFGINAAGQVVGVSGDAAGAYGGYLRTTGGTFTPVAFPGATGETDPIGINALGTITGFYDDGTAFFGFLRRGGVYSTFPQAAGFTETIPNKVNDLDQVVGTYMSSDGAIHGFLATPVPEPGSFALVAAGAAGAAWRRVRRR
jgi:hypothetical protein